MSSAVVSGRIVMVSSSNTCRNSLVRAIYVSASLMSRLHVDEVWRDPVDREIELPHRSRFFDVGPRRGLPETQLRIVARDQAVALRRQVDADEMPCSALRRFGRQHLERGNFHLPPQDAAAHQPGIDEPIPGITRVVGASNDDADQSIVAEAVAQPEGEADRSRGGEQPLDLDLSIPSRREVELVSLVDELRDTG